MFILRIIICFNVYIAYYFVLMFILRIIFVLMYIYTYIYHIVIIFNVNPDYEQWF